MKALVILASFLAASLLVHGSDVVELTEDNFDSLVSQGTWMVKVFAPWCSHCRKVRPVWEELATLLKDEGIHTGSIDGSKETVLAQRFETKGFPSFYHLKDGQCREYNGQRTVHYFAQFAREGYHEVEPVSFYRAPNGAFGRLMASARRMPTTVQETYQWLYMEKHFSLITILAMTLCIPVSIGLTMICLLDCLHSRSQRRDRRERPHVD